MSALAALEPLLADNRAAVDEFAARAAAIPPDRWLQPRAPGKWTPAQETKHVALAYEIFARDLAGGAPMSLFGTRWQRWVWKLIAFRRIVATGRMPRPVRAPREARPPEAPGAQGALIDELRSRAAEFERRLRDVAAREPRRRVTHAYFGALTLVEGLRLAAVHTRHHARFLPGDD